MSSFVIRHRQRDLVQQVLAGAGIGTMIQYPVPPHQQPAYAELKVKEGMFPIAERMAVEVLSLPMGPHLADSECESVISAIKHAGAD